MPFTHLHVHSQYSILDGAAPVPQIVSKAKKDGMTAVALTDHGVMHGIKEFHNACMGAGIKPLLGFEGYMVNDLANKKDRSNYHLVLIAKNKIGYRNLLKLTSTANIEGMYYRPRFDRKLLKEHSEGLIISSACLGGEIPQYIMMGELEKAEESIMWFKNIFGEDYYLELQRHPNNNPWDNVWNNQQLVNKHLIELSKKTGVKLIATNDSHFVNEEDADAHDLLVCMSTGKDYDDPKRMRYTRQEWFKSTAEMEKLFSDIPEAITNTQEIADKVEIYQLNAAPIMPEFPIPAEFGTMEEYKAKYDQSLLGEFKFSEEETDENVLNRMGGFDKILRVKFEADYLSHLTYNGAKERYGDPMNDTQSERLAFELDTIKKMGFPGYFLIVQDFIAEARNMGVLVGPGRGSAAGAVVSYCLGITNIDPIKYDLLFERFLNPDRISMPDIDIDFDDDGRQLVLEWVTNKYGHDKVSHICTFGSMAAKSSIKDVARVLKLPLTETNRMTKDFPENGKLNHAYQLLEQRVQEGDNLENAAQYWKNYLKKDGTNKKLFPPPEVLDYFVTELNEARNNRNRIKEDTLKFACALEGSVRQTGVHACGILIGKDPLVEHIPLMPAKGEELLNTQYDGRFVEDIGLLKMDFLGLKTLSIIKETLSNIKHSKGIDIDMDNISLEDEKTFELFCNGNTTAIFQFESPGMKKNLRSLQPNRFEDLVAMNALYRPGPMEYIPNYIERKHGREDVAYDHPMMEKYLKDTHGITVFQEQVMLLSRHLANFTRGESDSLRKAMGKKKMDMMAKLKVKFVEGCLNNPPFMEGYKNEVDKKAFKKPEDLIEKIWKDWEAFASYAFNKSHSVCYADVAYRTAYLKAHYPAEFMAGILSCNLGNADKIAIFMDECRQMRLNVLGPDVNESMSKFAVNANGDIRFGMDGIKGTGKSAVINIIEEREKNGKYKDIYDFAERINLSAVTKKTWESLAMSGGFDNLDNYKRSQYFAEEPDTQMSFISRLISFGNQMKADKEEMANSLFGDIMESQNTIKRPTPTPCIDWTNLHQLKQEKELIGIYLSAHPLDMFKHQIKTFCNTTLKDMKDLYDLEGRNVSIAGIITSVTERITKKGNPFGKITIEDHFGSFEHAFFGKDWIEKFKAKCVEDYAIMLTGKVQQKEWGDKAIFFNVTDIQLLSTISEDRINGITINLPYDSINNTLIDLLKETINEAVDYEKGKRLKINIINPDTGDKIRLHSGKIALKLENQFLDKLSAITLSRKSDSEGDEETEVMEQNLQFSLN